MAPSRTRSRIALLFALAAAFAAPRTAHAAGAEGVQRVAVIRVEVEGTVPPAVRDLLARRLVEGLTAVKLEVLPQGQVVDRLRGQSVLADCRASACYPDVARRLDVGYLVTAKVVESSKTYAIVLDMINGRTGAAVASSKERCETCGFEEAGEKVALAASSLRARLESLARDPARVVIRSKPSGAFVTIDGRRIGPTPVDLELSAGRHQVSLALEGHVAVDRTLTIVSGVEETVEHEMVRIPSAFPLRTMGIGAVVVGALVIAGGIWALARDGADVSCSADVKDTAGRCPKVWSTKAGGAAMLGLGAAAASLGGVLIYVGRDSTPAGERASVRVGYQGRF